MKDKNATQATSKILSDASDYASREFASTDLSDKRKDVFIEARTARRIQVTGENASKEYYKETGRHFDNDDGTEAYIRIIAMSFAYAIMALLINLILYLPVNYLATSWGDVNSHDAIYITIIINTAISVILVGISTEISTKRKAFIAGMHAEATDRIVGKYHEAKEINKKSHTDY